MIWAAWLSWFPYGFLSYIFLTRFVLAQTKTHFKISITLGNFTSFYCSSCFSPFLLHSLFLGISLGPLTSEGKSTNTYLSYFISFCFAMPFKYLFLDSLWVSASLKPLEVSLPKGKLASLFSHVAKLQTRQQRCPGDAGRSDDGAV